MSFHTTSAAGGGPVYDTVFRQILQVKDCVGASEYGCLSGVIQNDLLYALFIPHVILLIYLYIMARTSKMFQAHKGMGTLFGATIYIFLVFSGWYGILASYLVWWLVLTIILSLTMFFFGRFVHPSETGTRFRIGRMYQERAAASKEKAGNIDELTRYLRELRADLAKVQTEKAAPGMTEKEKSTKDEEIAAIRTAIRETERQLRKVQRG